MMVPVLAAAADDETVVPIDIAEQGRDSLLGLPVDEWGRLQLEDASLLALRRRAGERGRVTGHADAWETHAGLLMHWDGKSQRHRLVVPSGLRGKLQIPVPLGKSKLDDHVKFNLDKLTEARDAARLNSDRRQKANERLRLARAHVLQWKPGDRAWLHCPQMRFCGRLGNCSFCCSLEMNDVGRPRSSTAMFPTRGIASVLLLSAVLLCACQLAQGGVSFLPNDFKNEDKKAPTEVVQRRSEGAERYTDDDTEQIKIMAPLEVGIAMSFDEYRKYGAILNEMFKELLNVDLIDLPVTDTAPVCVLVGDASEDGGAQATGRAHGRGVELALLQVGDRGGKPQADMSLLHQGATAPLAATAAAPGAALRGDAGADATPAANEGWRRVVEQIESLRAVLLSLVTLVASSAAPGRPQDAMPSADDQGLLRGVSEETAAITPAAWSEPAILGAIATAAPVAAILVEPPAAG
ncbi:unnamed protein product [Lampetra planeri]